MTAERIAAKAAERKKELEARADRAERARLIVESPILTEAFEALEKEYYDAALAESNEKVRCKLLTAINNLRGVRKHLTAKVEDGARAVIQLREITGKRWL